MAQQNNRNNGRRNNTGFDKRTVSIRRVSKVTKGGKRLRFSAFVIVGDRKGSVGVGLGRGSDTRSAVEKGERVAIKKMKKIKLVGDTIPHEITHKRGAAKLILRPAKMGTGIIAGSSVRTVLELAGIENVYGKLLGSNDPIANAYCAFEALQLLENERVLKKMKVMRERIDIKKEVDKEREVKEAKRRSAKKKERREDPRKRTYNKRK